MAPSAKKKDPHAEAQAAAAAAAQTKFGITLDALKNLVLEKDAAAITPLGGPTGLAAHLHSDVERGIESSQAALARTAFGINQLPDKKLKSFLAHLIDALSDVVLIALIIAAVVTIVFGAAVTKDTAEVAEGIAIMAAVAVVSGVSSIQNYQQEKQFQSLSKVKADRTVLVIRDGHEQSVSVYDVVVGDIFVIKQGEILPCDGLFLTGNGIKCDESAMTGEPIEISKSVEKPYLLAGAQVTAGAGTMLVLTTGINTSYGQIVKDLESAEPPATPLQEKLETLAKRIGYIGLSGGLLLFFLLLFIYIGTVHPNYPNAFRNILSFFIIGIVIVVVGVPEGLPLAVTLTLAYSMKQMIKDNVLVRELNACETMGSATTICSDKTGTLTENRMTVVRGVFFGARSDAAVPSLEAIGGATRRDLLARAISLNSDANVRYTDTKIDFVGNKTEGALLHMLRKDFGVDPNFVRATAPKFVYRENFSSARKRMSTIYGPDSAALSATPLPTAPAPAAGTGATAAVKADPSAFPGSGEYACFTKGASEMVLSLCTTYMKPDGTLEPLTEEHKNELLAAIETYASGGLRTLSIAYRTLNASQVPALPAGSPQSAVETAWEEAIAAGNIEAGLTLLLIAGIQDPVRAAVPTAVAQCKSAGIKVRMVTGDNLLTAKAIAIECGIFTGGTVMEGKEWRGLTDEQREVVVVKLDVLARAIPSDKLLLVETLKRLGETVAVTGDGTNDAPALRAAHVGCAMGIAGTEVAKEAGKMIILDDNFASIVVAVVWGRSVLENIRKFLVFQLTINLVAGGLTFIVAMKNSGANLHLPLEPIHLLWINLIMDSFAALMLATEPPDAELMKMKPQGKQVPLMSVVMNKYVVIHAIYQIAMLLWMTLSDAGCRLYGLDPSEIGSRIHYTNIFNSFVWFQLFNLFNARRIHDQWDILKNIHRSTIGVSMLFIIVVLQIIIVELGGTAFKTTPLTIPMWFVSIALGATSIPIGWLCRLVPIREKESLNEVHEAPSSASSAEPAAKDAAMVIRVQAPAAEES
jgi:P-type Ca2+ transporter type 2C